MKSILINLLLLVYVASFAQETQHGYIKYNIIYASDGFLPEQYIGELGFENMKTIFVYNKSTMQAPKKVDTLTKSGQKMIMVRKGSMSDNVGKMVYVDFLKNELVCREVISKKPFIVIDTIVKPQWDIGSKEKKIGTFVCQNATTHYYGRDYEVWFTTELAAPYGPWKLNGLPGIILEAHSLDGVVSFVAEKVELVQNAGLRIYPPEDGEMINGYLEFRKKQDKNAADRTKYAQAIFQERSKLGAKITLKEISPSRFEKSID
jgi:GLPGLI family protein